jgi:hypothetical protein
VIVGEGQEEVIAGVQQYPEREQGPARGVRGLDERQNGQRYRACRGGRHRHDGQPIALDLDQCVPSGMHRGCKQNQGADLEAHVVLTRCRSPGR